MEEGAMAKELLPDAFWARIAPLFVLKTGIPWEYLPAEMGCGSGMTCWRRLHQVLLEELAQADRIDDDARHRRRHRAHPRQDARQAPSPTAQAPCRQGLRLPSPPSGHAQAPHHPRIARCGVEPKNRLGRYRWVVERTLSWLNRFRRLKIRYEHRADIHLAFLQLGCALISLRFLG